MFERKPRASVADFARKRFCSDACRRTPLKVANCEFCGNRLRKSASEQPGQFNIRRFCSTACAFPNMHRTHGHTADNRMSPEYGAWARMVARCTRAGHQDYRHYGGRGIRVCDRWRADFAAFYMDMGRKPTAAHTLDRIDNDGHYEPGNCRWATRKEQARNTRRCHWITINGETRLLTDWLLTVGRSSPCYWRRVRILGWTPEQALFTPTPRRWRRAQTQSRELER